MSLISRYEHLPRRPRSDETRPLLEKIASQVKPIMTKRGWKVGTLAEFFPTNPSLLGLNTNSGQKINLRLRPPDSPDSFYEFDQLVLVMLHELTHNEIGPHNAAFYKLLAELEEEFYELKRKGYSGEGFNSTGRALTGLHRNEYEGRRVGLAAAEKRLATQLKMGKGGKLGGSGAGTAGKSMREIVAEAAQRRMADEVTCATTHDAEEARREVRRAEEESVGVDVDDLAVQGGKPNVRVMGGGGAGAISDEQRDGGRAKAQADVIVVDDSDDEVQHVAPANGSELSSSRSQPRRTKAASTGMSGPSGRQATTAHPPSSTTLRSASPVKRVAPDSVERSAATSRTRIPRQPTSEPMSKPSPVAVSNASRVAIPTEWSCPFCTLLNPLRHLQCGACGSERPADVAAAAQAAEREEQEASRRLGPVSDQQGWYCEVCTAGPRGWEYWTCDVCESVRKFG